MRTILAEALKTGTLWSTWLLVAANLALPTAVSIALYRSSEGADLASIEVGTLPFLLIGASALGAMLMSTEYGGRQLPTSLLAVPRRGGLLVAKAVLVVVVTTLVGWTWSNTFRLAIGQGFSWSLDRSTQLVLLGTVVVGLIGWGMAAATRDLIAALVITLGLVIVAPFLAQSWPPVHHWLPSSLITALIDQPDLDPRLLLALLGWVAAGALPGAVRLLLRDV